MASQSILLAGLKSPARVLMKPASTRSILRRPAPLPLSPNPLPFAASFSVVVNSSHLSPHVHFPSSPAMAAMFTTHSPNSYDRGPIIVSPGSAGLSLWASRPLSPSAHNSFKLLDPPKPKSILIKSTAQKRESQSVTVPEDPRPPKARNARASASESTQRLSAPTFVDPRSPKPYKARVGVTFDELSLHAPRGTRGAAVLGEALTTYPRSPYPSAPIEENGNTQNTEPRGRTIHRTPPPSRTRSLDNKSMKRRRNIGLRIASPLNLSPVREAPHFVAKPAPLDLEEDSLSQAFWESVSLEDEPESAYMTANETLGRIGSPAPEIMFGSKDGSLWTPQIPKKAGLCSLDSMTVLSPAQRRALSKGMVASPSPNDPFAAFPSFSVALMSGAIDGIIAYPPRAVVEQT